MMENNIEFDDIFKEKEGNNNKKKSRKENDCFEPICNKEDPLMKYRKYNQQDEEEQQEQQKDDCPNSKQSLGYFTWNFLHTMAIYYPEQPSERQKQLMHQMIEGLSEFYPCKECKFDFQRQILINKPKLDNNKDLSIWLCQQHNIVNKKLNKKTFDCTFDNLLKRWKYGYIHCNDQSQF